MSVERKRGAFREQLEKTIARSQESSSGSYDVFSPGGFHMHSSVQPHNCPDFFVNLFQIFCSPAVRTVSQDLSQLRAYLLLFNALRAALDRLMTASAQDGEMMPGKTCLDPCIVQYMLLMFSHLRTSFIASQQVVIIVQACLDTIPEHAVHHIIPGPVTAL